MRALRFLGNVALSLVAALGLLSALVWGATQAGWTQPLVVISGSMEPAIMTGDLLFATPEPTSELRVGDVATIPSARTGDLVSHRVVSVEPHGAGEWAVTMQGDVNDSPDAEVYVVGDAVLEPAWQIPGGGFVVTTLTRPAVAVPLAVALAALLGLSLLPRTSGQARTAPPATARVTAEVVR